MNQELSRYDRWMRKAYWVWRPVHWWWVDKIGYVRSFLPMPTFALKDRAAWRKCVAANRNGYGGAAVRYAATWARLMEQRMAEGKTLAEVAEQTSHDANTERITGFMYGAAVSMLAHAWVHGEDLRRWNNLELQIEDEGERANETGGVLNPALLIAMTGGDGDGR